MIGSPPTRHSNLSSLLGHAGVSLKNQSMSLNMLFKSKSTSVENNKAYSVVCCE